MAQPTMRTLPRLRFLLSEGSMSNSRAKRDSGMQTKLFEPFETDRGGESKEAPAHSKKMNARTSPYFKGFSQGAVDSNQDRGRAVVIRALSSEIYGIRNGLAAISFSDLVRESSGHLVLPIDPGNSDDVLLLKHLSQALTSFVRLTEKSGQRFTGNRINDVGKRFEYTIAEELRKTPLEVSVLGRPGYPDCILKQGERVTYLEIKTSASIRKEANRYLKTFSFSSGKKIKSDARHLLLKMQLEEEDNKIWKVVAWELRDLSTLKTRLKTEFNAGFGDLAVVRLLGSSVSAAKSLVVSGQSALVKPGPDAIHGNGRRRRFHNSWNLG
jgi:hypothetical protein